MKKLKYKFEYIRDCLKEIHISIREQDYHMASFRLGQLYIDCDENVKHYSIEPDTQEREFTLDDLMDRLNGSIDEIDKILKLLSRRVEI